MMNKEKENTSNFETILFHTQLPLDLHFPFREYLKEIYRDLISRSDSSDNDEKLFKLNRHLFESYLNIPLIINEKIFNSIAEKGSEYLEEKDFVDGMFNIYASDLEALKTITYKIFDFNNSGLIFKENTSLIFSYFHHSLTDLDLDIVKKIVNKFWENQKFMTFSEYCHRLEMNSDILILLICYLSHFKPYDIEGLQFFKQLIMFETEPYNNWKKINLYLDVNEYAQPSFDLVFYLNNFLNYNLKNQIGRKNSSRNLLQFGFINDEKLVEHQEEDEKDFILNSYECVNLFQNHHSPLNDHHIGYHENENMINFNIQNIKHKYNDNKLFEDSKDSHDFHEIDFNFSNNHHIEDNYLELNVYKIVEFKHQIQPYKIISIGRDIFYFCIKNNSIEYGGIHNLSGCMIDLSVCNKHLNINNEFYYPLRFINEYGENSIYDDFYFNNFEELKRCIEKLRARLNIRNISDFYILNEEIGSGQFGKVKIGIHKTTNDKVAIKIIKKSVIKKRHLLHIIKWELDIMRFLKNTTCPYVVKTFDIFQSCCNFYIVMEYLEGGTLHSMITRKDPGCVENLKDIVQQISKGIKYLHDFGIIHRDLKPDNVMLTTSTSIMNEIYNENSNEDHQIIPSVKIMDFGLSKVVGLYDSTTEGYGSLCYTAPEIILKRNYNHKVDVWSFGVLLYFSLTSTLPFDDPEDNINNIARKIVYSNDVHIPKFFGENKYDERSFKLVMLCLHKNPNKRLSIECILDHEWFLD